ncbi:hypothetical protein [Raoultibacter phocaeensis]|uniref:hypothetical protein n=1 Tax=Raoultibacter phocaeensis TaxID=2479841 RepID=UPI0011193AFD|nr:hypothetical protein [Raoultibacter phocaeensis]
MKDCPVCAATTFDDMEVCFSCLHRFVGEDECESETPADHAGFGNARILRYDAAERPKCGAGAEAKNNRRAQKPGETGEGRAEGSDEKPLEAGGSNSAARSSPASGTQNEAPYPSYRLEITLVPVGVQAR